MIVPGALPVMPALPAFEVEVFEDLHTRVVAPLVAAPSRHGRVSESHNELEAMAFEELRKRKDSFAAPFCFRGREDSLDLPSLARRVLASRPRLASEYLVRQVDDVSRVLRLSQDDCAALVERALDLGGDLKELPHTCSSMYYRECHFQALCLHDMAQSLTHETRDRCSVAFFAMLGGKQFVKALFEALGLLLRDLTGDRTGDQLFLSHAGAMIQLVVETMLAYFYTFKATAEEAEQIISLLPHVVMASHVPIGQGWTVSDLDLILREGHADISVKLCFALVCMCHPREADAGNGKLDINKQDLSTVTPATLSMQDLAPEADDILSTSPLGNKMRQATAQQPYWDEESQLGQFLCFAISGALMGDERALRYGYVHWHVLHFLLDEVLLSHTIVGDSCASRLVLSIMLDLLTKALLPDFRRWAAVKKLEAQAVSHRLTAPDGLQIAVLRTVNRLCRVYPLACEKFRDLALHCADTFHLTAAQSSTALSDNSVGASSGDPFGRRSGFVGQGGFLGQPTPGQLQTPGEMAIANAPQALYGGAAPWIGAPPSTVGTAHLPMLTARHDNSALYAEILDLVATICGRGSLTCAKHVATKLTSHSNQWFNWAFLLDTLMQHARAPAQFLLVDGAAGPGVDKAMRCFPSQVVVALCHMVSAMCSSHLWLCQPPPQLGGQVLQTMLYAGSPNVDNYGALLVELLGVHPEPTVKAACLGALAHLDFTPIGARTCFASITAILPTLLAGICAVRGSNGLLAIELLACALRLVQTVPLNRGRYSLDLQPLTHVVIHYIFLKVLSDMEEFAKAPRYWRLANLALRWLQMALHGPLPFGSSPAGNVVLIEPYAGGDPNIASQVAALSVAGNATVYVFRCLLALDSPVFTRVMYLATLRGRGVDGLSESRRNGSLRPFMDQTARVGLDVIRLLFQRDVLFCRLHSQRTKLHVEGHNAGLDDSTLLLTHKLLFAEFAFTYPPQESDELSMFNSNMNPFAGRRMWQGISAAPAGSGASGRQLNPSNFTLLLEFAGAQQSPDVSKLALFMFAQCSLREPATVLKMLQLESWRLHRFCVDLHNLILQPEGDNPASAKSELGSDWEKQHLGERFSFEVTEMDTPPDASSHLDMSSFLTGMSVCHAVDVIYQLEDDSLVQSADIVAFAAWAGLANNMRGLGLRATSADEAMFKAGYLRGLDIPSDWIGADAASAGQGGCAPPASFSMTSSRLLALRTIVMLQGEIMSERGPTSIAPKLAQVVLGLDPNSSQLDGAVEIDSKRNGQPAPLEAVMELLEHPPPTPSFASKSGKHASGGSARKQSVASSTIKQAVEQHASYEAALGILLSLLSTPKLCDVGFRYMVHMWPSRYRVLRDLLKLHWPAMPSALRRVMLAEATLMMEVVSWEMRLVKPFGSPPPSQVESLSIVGRQRLDMKQAVAEHLQDVARSFVSDSELSTTSHGETPLLVAIAQQLADACAMATTALAQPNGSMFSRDGTYEALQASGCMCLAPSLEGPLKLGIELRDPHTFLCLAGRGYRMLSTPGMLSHTPVSSYQAQYDVGTQSIDALRDVGEFNEAACMSFLSSNVFRSLCLFVSALLYHLAGGMRPSTIIRDPRAQALRAHLEALLPELASQMIDTQPPCRIETFASFAASLISAMQRVEAPAPLTFMYDTFRVLRGVAVHADTTNDARSHANHGLLLLLQRMLPALESNVGTGVPNVELTDDDLEELRKLVRGLLARSSSPTTDASKTYADAPVAAPSSDTALPLLAALLARVPATQLKLLFPTPDLWQQLTALLRTVPIATPRGLKLQCAAMSVAVALCRTPALASALYESGGFVAVLEMELMQNSKVQIAPAGLSVLEVPHPAIILSVLEMLVTIVGALPTHRMVLSLALNWVEQHHRMLLELLQWVSRLPIATAAEPRPLDSGSLSSQFGGDDFGAALQAATTVNTIVELSAGAIHDSLLLVFCSSGVTAEEIVSDTTMELISITLSGRCWSADLNSNSSVDSRDRVVALCYRCASLFSELHAALAVAVQKCIGPPGSLALGQQHPLLAQASRVTSVFEPTLSLLLTQMAAAELPRSRDTIMQDSAQSNQAANDADQTSRYLGRNLPAHTAAGSSASPNPSNTNDVGLYASEATRLAVCMHILHAWRHDASTIQILTLIEQCSSSVGAGIRLTTPGCFGGTTTPVASNVGVLAVAEASSMVSQLVSLARSRVNVLCTVFVHTCNQLLAMRPVSRQRAGIDHNVGDSPHLEFGGTRDHFRHSLFIVEVSLHLLQTHVTALILGGLGAAPTPGAPRMPLVLQYLRVLQQFATTVGGKVALTERSPSGNGPGISAAPGNYATVQAVDVAYTARAAECVEQSLLQLQSL